MGRSITSVSAMRSAVYRSSTSAGAIAGSRSALALSRHGSFTHSTPSVMDERPRERRLPGDLADQTVVVRSVAGRDRDLRAFALFTHRAYPEMFNENGLAPFMKNAAGTAHLGVAVCGDVVHQKVDEATSLLQNGEKIDNFGVGLVRKRRSYRGGIFLAGPADSTFERSARMATSNRTANPAITFGRMSA
jgi:hypothetical protein